MFNRKGQNIAEYSILIALVIAAAVAMQVYVKRGVQGRVADAVDHTGGTVGTDVGGSALTFSGKQFEPDYVDTSANVSSNRGLQENTSAGGIVNRTSVNETTTRAAGSYEKTTYNANTATPVPETPQQNP